MRNRATALKTYHEVKLFLVSGPSLLGWILGFIVYPYNSVIFVASVQNALLSLAFLLGYGFFYILRYFFGLTMGNADLVVQSIITVVYVSLTSYIYYMMRNKSVLPGRAYIESLLDRIIPKQEQSS